MGNYSNAKQYRKLHKINTKKYIWNNGCFAHREQISVAILSDDHYHIKLLDSLYIINSWSRVNNVITEVELPASNFEADYYVYNVTD